MTVRKSVLIALALGIGIAVAGMTATGASAGSTDAKVDPGVVLTPAQVSDPATGHTSTIKGAADLRTVEEYWTPERMAAAIPDAPAHPDRAATALSPKAMAPAKEIAVGPAAAKATGGLSPLAATGFALTAGKVFYTKPWLGQDFVCSGSTINTPRRRVVLTAGHCVHGGPGTGFVTNWAFVPGYDNNSRPAGTFTALGFATRTGWTKDGDFSKDYAFVVTGDNEFGQRVVDAVGANGIIFNSGKPTVHIIGYPGATDNGQTQQVCDTTTTDRNLVNNDFQGNCRMRGGSSGGPWLRDFDATIGQGQVVTNTSYSFSDEPSHLFGPYFDSDTRTTMNTADNGSPA
jgi:V8-like Glu-specific endopeptidase